MQIFISLVFLLYLYLSFFVFESETSSISTNETQSNQTNTTNNTRPWWVSSKEDDEKEEREKAEARRKAEEERNAAFQEEQKGMDSFWVALFTFPGAFEVTENIEPGDRSIIPDLDTGDLMSQVNALKKQWVIVETNTSRLWGWGGAYYETFLELMPWKKFYNLEGAIHQMATEKCVLWNENTTIIAINPRDPSKPSYMFNTTIHKPGGNITAECLKWFKVSLRAATDVLYHDPLPEYMYIFDDAMQLFLDELDNLNSYKASSQNNRYLRSISTLKKHLARMKKGINMAVDRVYSLYQWLKFQREAMIVLDKYQNVSATEIDDEMHVKCKKQCKVSPSYLSYVDAVLPLQDLYPPAVHRMQEQVESIGQALEKLK